jgi:hypothetical protein
MNRKREIVSIVLFTVMLLAIAILPGLAGKGASAAASDVSNVEFVIGVSRYFVNGQTPGITMDVAPFIRNDRTYVPVRFLANALGVTDENIEWDGVARKVYITQPGTAISLTIDQASITVNGQAKAIDVAPLIESDRTFLPAQFVAEALGYTVEWDDSNKIVICYKGTERPDISAVISDVGGSTNPQTGGYWVPGNLHGVGAASPSAIDGGDRPIFDITVDTLEPLTEQYSVVHAILVKNGFADESTAAKILDVVRSKTGFTPALDAEFSYKSYRINVGSGGYSNYISVYIWS